MRFIGKHPRVVEEIPKARMPSEPFQNLRRICVGTDGSEASATALAGRRGSLPKDDFFGHLLTAGGGAGKNQAL